MRKTIIHIIPVLIATAFLLLPLSCSSVHAEKDGKEEGRGVLLYAGIPSLTRAVYPATAAEMAVDHVDWLVYDSFGDLAFHERTAGRSVEAHLQPGTYSFVAVANYPSVISDDTVATLADYEDGLTVTYGECGLDAASHIVDGTPLEPVFVMRSDVTEAFVIPLDVVDLTLKRIAVRVVVDPSITWTPAFNAVHTSPSDKTVYGFFLVNVPSEIAVSDGAMAGSSWTYEAAERFEDIFDAGGPFWNAYPLYDPAGDPSDWDFSSPSFTSLFPEWFLPLSYLPALAAKTGHGYMEGDGGYHLLYCHPNAETEAPSAFETDMQTKLVLWTATGFYNIPLPGIVGNRSVYITDINIDGYGSSYPGASPGDPGTVRYNLTLLDPWVRDGSLSSELHLLP